MLLFNKKIKRFIWKFLKKISLNKYQCSIEEIDTAKETVTINAKGTCSPIKLKFDEVIHDILVLSNLPPLQASWIGYYYGIKYGSSAMHSPSNLTNYKFCFDEFQSKFKLLFVDRFNNITYLNRKNGNNVTTSPIIILKDTSLIRNFSSLEACYIGILWGIYIHKKNHRNVSYPSYQVDLRAVD